MLAAHAFLVYQQEQQAELQAALARLPTLAGQYAEAVSAARRMMDEPPESFAGSGDTTVQHLLRRGEELVHAGQYYQAKSFFERAEFLDRNNPLILLAHGHAMLAAGEYYSAALRLSRAVELFPGIAHFKIDLTKFIPEPDLLEKRRADLERRLEVKEDYRFRFVLGYAECFSGLEKYGLENLRRAAELAPENSGMARLHHLMTMNLPDLPK
jgi:tetratricopeptide (TPR) repeat protein